MQCAVFNDHYLLSKTSTNSLFGEEDSGIVKPILEDTQKLQAANDFGFQ